MGAAPHQKKTNTTTPCGLWSLDPLSGGCQGRKEGLSCDISLWFVNLGCCSAAQCSAQGSPEKSSIWNIYSEHKLKVHSLPWGRGIPGMVYVLLLYLKILWWIFVPPDFVLCTPWAPRMPWGWQVLCKEFSCSRSMGWSLLEKAGSFIRHLPQSHEIWGSDGTDHSFLCSAIDRKADKCVQNSLSRGIPWKLLPMFMPEKFPGAKVVHLQKANWSIRTSAESKPKQNEITVNLCLFELLDKS